MSVDVYVEVPPGSPLPDPKERISSFYPSPGNILMAPLEVGGKRLDEYGDHRIEAMKVLELVIAEIDKGNQGAFNDAWCTAADLRWSKGQEKAQACAFLRDLRSRQTLPEYMRSDDAYWGRVMRERIREEGLRFYLYYAVGYIIRWS